MEHRYNIALLPLTQSSQAIQYAQIFSGIFDQYLVGKNSLPHVTLCQFLASPHEALRIWHQVCNSLKQKSIRLSFNKVTSLSFDKQLFWIWLLPEHSEELIQMHQQVADIVQRPLNQSYQNYFPHLSLANTQNSQHPSLVEKLLTLYIPFEDTCLLSLGKSDDAGQFIGVEEHCPLHAL